MTILSQLFEVSRKEWGIYVHNPVRDFKLPAENSARNRRLQDAQDGSDSEEARLFAACRRSRNPYLLPIVKLALETAMRQSELVRMHWRHIDLKRRTIFLPQTKNGNSENIMIVLASNGESFHSGDCAFDRLSKLAITLVQPIADPHVRFINADQSGEIDGCCY